jgi:hypothetical protein
MNPYFIEMLSALFAADAEFMVVGAHALAAHGVPRATGDLDIFVRATSENARRVLTALRAFGAPLFELTERDLSTPDTVFQIGLPPSRIDLLTSISGVTFDDAWPRHMDVTLGTLIVPVIGRDDFVTNKKAAGRTKDLLDVQMLDQ